MKNFFLILVITVLGLTACSSVSNSEKEVNDDSQYNVVDAETTKQEPESIQSEKKDLVFDFYECYNRRIDKFQNTYYIDENNVLWGKGRNEYGQLGMGYHDFDDHEESVKIAENVIHVDYSGYGFMIYITGDNELYGVGNAYSGVFPDVNMFYDQGGIGTGAYIGACEPQLIAKDVVYANCGQTDVIYINSINELWTVGVVWYLDFKNYCYNARPTKLLDNVAYISSNWFNHVALTTDGTVWTWGYNLYGNCGVQDEYVVSIPIKVMNNADMAWNGNQIVDNFEKNNNFGEANTFVKCTDGTIWMCGENAGDEEKVVPYYYPETKSNWSYKFIQIN